MIAQSEFLYAIRHAAMKERRICVGLLLNSQTQGIPSKIVDYHLDERFDWIADLECGHQQHVRHDPPWINRHWVTTPQGRYEHIGFELQCSACQAPLSSMNLL
jgi:hypothetical protein